MSMIWPWITLALLGAYHGLNPGMGWLFALAIGLQERRRGAVLRAVGPIAVGVGLSATTSQTVSIVMSRFLSRACRNGAPGPERATKNSMRAGVTRLPGTRLSAHPDEVDVASLGQGWSHALHRNTRRAPWSTLWEKLPQTGIQPVVRATHAL
jgi:hypothetical protein